MTDVVSDNQPPERVLTGIPGLDVVLNGGLLKDGIYILLGPPGAGKTILGNQICFSHVSTGGRAVYVTLLAETHSRMIGHLRSMQFFDTSKIANAISYVSGYRALESEGLRGLLEVLRREIRNQRATLLVLDGLVTAEAVAESELAFKKFIHELHTLIGVMKCTTLLLTNGSDRSAHPEHTMVDGLIELTDETVGLRASRELQVRKFRGSDHLRGRHNFVINNTGVVVFPRLEAVAAQHKHVPAEHAVRLEFGVPRLDEMLEGGVPTGSTTLLLGPTGVGKTLLGLQFLAEGARLDQRGLYFGFFESPPRLVAKADRIGMQIGEANARSLIEIIWRPAPESGLDELAQIVLESVRRTRVRRLFIDGIVGFKDATLYPERLGRFFGAFTNELRSLDLTTVVSEEARELFGASVEVPLPGVSAAMENVLLIRQVEVRSRLRKVISVLKTRETEHASELREFLISERGIDIGNTFDGADGLMTGVSRTRVAKRGSPRARKGSSRRGGK